jgi:hypothetical protein
MIDGLASRSNCNAATNATASSSVQISLNSKSDSKLETERIKMATGLPVEVVTNRLAVVLHPNLEVGQAINAAAAVMGGLRCVAFDEPILDASGHLHAAIRWNMPVLKAKNEGQLKRLLVAARQARVKAVAFTNSGQSFSNSFLAYCEFIRMHDMEALPIIAIGLFGEDANVRLLTKSFSVFR